MTNESIIVAIITAAGSVLVAALTFYLTKRHALKVEWQQQKLNHYKVLLSALSDLVVDGTDKRDAHIRFCLAVNTMALVAPQYVIDALMQFQNEVNCRNPDIPPERCSLLLKGLLLAVRKDIGLSGKDNPETFCFHLIGPAPPPAS
jgi:hypothetical protein